MVTQNLHVGTFHYLAQGHRITYKLLNNQRCNTLWNKWLFRDKESRYKTPSISYGTGTQIIKYTLIKTEQWICYCMLGFVYINNMQLKWKEILVENDDTVISNVHSIKASIVQAHSQGVGVQVCALQPVWNLDAPTANMQNIKDRTQWSEVSSAKKISHRRSMMEKKSTVVTDREGEHQMTET